MRGIVTIGLTAFLVGCGSSGIEGTLIDGMTGQPIPEMRLVAHAVDPVGLTCQAAQGDADASGAFKIDNACIGESSYRIEADDKNLWFAEMPVVAKGTTGPITLQAWRAGEGSGVYELSGTSLTRIGTEGARPVKVFETDVEVVRPREIPGNVPVIEEGEHLVLSGKATVNDLAFHPLLPSGPRKFGNSEEWLELDPWWYVGMSFETDTDYTEHTAELDTSKVIRKEGGDRAAMYVPHDALPPGRYALMKPGDKRLHIVDFVKAPELPSSETADSGE